MSLQASPVYIDYLAGLAKSHTLPAVGIVLGMTRANHPDTVVHMCRLFKSEDEEPADEEERKEALVDDCEDILHMLTPGVEVLGSFVVCKSDDVVKDQPAWDRVKLLYRVIRKLCGEQRQHYILVHNAQAANGKQTSAKLVVGDKSNLDKNELKSISVDFSDRKPFNFVQVDAQFSLTRSAFLRSYDWAKGERGQMPMKRLRESLCGADLERTLDQALITFNGEMSNGKIRDLVTRREDAGADSSKLNPVIAEIYEKNVPIDENEDVKRSNDVMRLKGCVASRLFVYPDDTLAHVESLLRKDLINSIQQRIQRATDLASTSPDGDGKDEVIALEELTGRMGRRIYFTIQPSNIQLFDYLYPDEGEDQLRERINAKLDIDVEVTDIFFDLEEDGDGGDGDGGGGGALIKTIEQTVADTTKEITSQLGNRKGFYLVVRFLLVAVLAIVIPLVFNSKKDNKQ